MAAFLARLRRFYGSHPLHLLTMAAGLALAGYAVFTFNPATLWNPHAWWQSIAVWLGAAIIVHDLALFPLYALADRLLGIASRRRQRRPRGQLRVLARNYLRIPALGSGLTLLMFWPGIVKQGSATYVAATGHTQQPFLGRWLLLTAAMFTASALLYAIRLMLAHRRTSDGDVRATHDRQAPTRHGTSARSQTTKRQPRRDHCPTDLR
jgi:hypothetical protein